MKNVLISLIFGLLLPIVGYSQIGGERQVPSANYPNLMTIADSLNLFGVAQGGVAFVVQGNVVFNEIPILFTASGTEDSPVAIVWNGIGVKPVINFSGTSSSTDAGITLKGSDFFTINGLDIQNPGNDLEYGIWITNESAIDGAHQNTIKNIQITLNKLNPFQTEGIRVAPVITATAFEGNNHHNKFYNNVIQNVMIGYSFDGSNSNTLLMSVGNEIGTEEGGSSIISDIVMAGVLIDDQNGFSLSNTTIQNLTRIGSGTTAPAGISTLSGNPSEPLTNDFIFFNNIIKEATSSFTSVYGCYFSARKATYYISNNLIQNITATGGGSNTSDGIIVFGTDITSNVYNNMISGIAAPASAISGNAASRGINVRTYSQANIFYNTVLLDFEATNPAHSSAAFIIYNNTDPVVMRNNIFINKTTFPEGATGIGAAFFKRTPALTNIDGETDNNIYFAGDPSANNVIFYGHNSSAPAIDQTLEAYQARAITFDQNSFTEDVQFISNNDLHVEPLAETLARGNATPVITPIIIDSDYDGSPRDATNPDIGADELANPYPDLAINPLPENGSNNVPVSLSNLQWSYFISPEFINPAAFKVYLNTTPDFTGIEPVAIVNWELGVENYSANIPLLDYETEYFWVVVPTANLNGGPEAPEVEVWQFQTEIFVYPYPSVAGNPDPSGVGDVSVSLSELQWEYIDLVNYTSPAGFKVYIGINPVLNEADFLAWVPYTTGQLDYMASLAGSPLEYATTYYWIVVPTVDQNNGPDAQGVEIWSFSTQLIPYPNSVVNPDPEDGGIIRIGNTQYVAFSWQYFPENDHVLPVSFKVFGATDTTSAVWQIPLTEIAYFPGQSDYDCNFTDSPNFTYQFDVPNYWKVIPVAAAGQENLDFNPWSFEFDEYLGLDENSDVSIFLFPNPTSGVVYVETKNNISSEIVILDSSGKQLHTEKSEGGSFSIDLSSYRAGIYSIQVNCGGVISSRKVMLNNK